MQIWEFVFRNLQINFVYWFNNMIEQQYILFYILLFNYLVEPTPATKHNYQVPIKVEYIDIIYLHLPISSNVT